MRTLIGLVMLIVLCGSACVAAGGPVGASAHTTVASSQVHLRSVSQRRLRAICVRLSRPGPSHHVTRRRAVRAVENLKVLRRYGKRVPITGWALAKVAAKDPSLAPDHNVVFWVLASRQAPHVTELFFVRAKNAKVVTYMSLGDGCLQ